METERFAPNAERRAKHRREWGVGDDEIVVGTVARLFKNKGYDEIVAAMPSAVQREPRLRFVWIGGGAHRARYERQLEAIGLRNKVRLLGLVPPHEVASCLNGFDLLVHASRWEGLPRAVVQALLTQVPAVSFDNDGAPEVVAPEETGILVHYGDVAGLGDAMVRLGKDAALRRRFGERGRERCVHLFDSRKMVNDLESLYIRLLTDQRA